MSAGPWLAILADSCFDMRCAAGLAELEVNALAEASVEWREWMRRPSGDQVRRGDNIKSKLGSQDCCGEGECAPMKKKSATPIKPKGEYLRACWVLQRREVLTELDVEATRRKTLGVVCAVCCGRASLYGRRGGRFCEGRGDAWARILLWAAD